MVGKNKDLDILLGEPKKAIQSMVVAFLLALAVVRINKFVDTFWVAGLGAASGSAVATVTPIYGLMMCAAVGISVGATTTISFRIGRREMEEANKLASSSIVLGIVCAAISSVLIAIFSKPLLNFIGAGEIIDECFSYLLPHILFSPLLLCNTIMGGILRGEGASRKSATVQMSAAGFNMVFDPIFIYGAGWGVFGAGFSTVFSAGLATLVGLRWFTTGKTAVKLERKNFKLDRLVSVEILEVGGPRTVQAMIAEGTALIQRIFLIAAGGINAVMFYNYPWKYINLINLPAKAYGNAMLPVCASAYGQRDFGRMRIGFVYTTKIVLIFSVIASILIFVFAEQLMTVLTYAETMRPLRPHFVWTLRMTALFIPFHAMMSISSSLLQSLKKAKMSTDCYFVWGLLKLGMYAIAGLVYHSYKLIVYFMVIVYVFGGVFMTYLAIWQFRKASKTASEAPADAANDP